MKKNIYIFNCKELADCLSIVKIYNSIAKIASLSCNKYSFIYKTLDNKMHGRSGLAKNMEKNITNYFNDPHCDFSSSNFISLEIFDQPQGTNRWELEKRSCGFYAERLNNQTTNFYLITSNALETYQIFNLWNCFSKIYNLNYMISFSLESSKQPEIYMYGRQIYPVFADVHSYYSAEEMLIVQKLYDLRSCYVFDLNNVFPMCITTKDILIDEHEYSTKKSINKDVFFFVK